MKGAEVVTYLMSSQNYRGGCNRGPTKRKLLGKPVGGLRKSTH